MPPGRDAVQAQYALFTFLAVLIVWGVMAWWVAFVLDRLLRKQYTCTLFDMVSQHLKWPQAWWVPAHLQLGALARYLGCFLVKLSHPAVPPLFS
jgi:hypothetical protein